MQSAELTLIVAATRSMGIGLNGSMPWTGLRREMQYFSRVTSRVPPSAPPGAMNAVIMGRKTWDSIPPKFRPLPNRLNIVISRAATSSAASASDDAAPEPEPPGTGTVVRVSSLGQALSYVTHHSARIGRVFVMGGGQIYDQALPQAKRILLTSIQKEYVCDTFFGLDPERAAAEGWEKKRVEAWRAWTGEEGDASQEEAGVAYEWQMWER